LHAIAAWLTGLNARESWAWRAAAMTAFARAADTLWPHEADTIS